jgi:hypothetical protein
MNPIRRLGAALAGLAGVQLTFAAVPAVAPALARPFPPRPPGWNKHPPPGAGSHIVVVGGMPGWQIALIAIGAALLAATAAVLADRAWTTRRKTITAAA